MKKILYLISIGTMIAVANCAVAADLGKPITISGWSSILRVLTPRISTSP